MTYQGHVQNGVVLLENGIQLPDGVKVRVEVADQPQEAEDEGPTLYEQLEPIIGIAKGLPSDLAENHDHYLHGRLKR